MRVAILYIAAFFVGLKVVAYLWATSRFCAEGNSLAWRVRKRCLDPATITPASLNPIDKALATYRIASGEDKSPHRASALLALFTAPAIVTIASICQFAVGSSQHRTPTLALGVLAAACSMLALVMGVLRRLILGSRDADTPDVELPALIKDWDAAQPGHNTPVYFLVLVYMAVVGFADLYFGIHGFDAGAFANYTHHSEALTAMYLSVTTLATVGYGDIHPVADGARVAVMLQILTGPLLLSWLLATFLSASQTITAVDDHTD